MPIIYQLEITKYVNQTYKNMVYNKFQITRTAWRDNLRYCNSNNLIIAEDINANDLVQIRERKS